MGRALLVICLLACTAVAILPPFFHGRPAAGFKQYGDRLASERGAGHWESLTNGAADPYPGLQRLNFTQSLTHFNNSDTRTYQQRYWYNPNYTKNKNIIFLMIEGESEATDLWVGYGGYQYLQMAKKHGADVFQLEHRCFGYSRPFDNLSKETLEFCTIDEALADIASFITAMNALHKFENPKWVTFGGSYPGILSALFRKLYPQLTVGAVSSSAPLTFTLDSWEYALSVEETLRTIPGCAEAVQESFTEAQRLSFSPDGRKQLSDWLKLAPAFVEPVSAHDIDNLFANLFAVFQGIVQYTGDGRNDDTKGGLGINGACVVMKNRANEPNPVKRLRNVIMWFNAFPSNGANPDADFPNSYDDIIAALKNETFLDVDQAANRGWVWLQCNQIGAEQTTDQGRNIFGQILPLNYFIDMCTDGYGDWMNLKEQLARTDRARQSFGFGDDYTATNIVLSNGSFDPWHKLGFYKSDAANNVTAILIPGTAHCSDMYPEYPGEPVALAGARATIAKEVARFIGEPL